MSGILGLLNLTDGDRKFGQTVGQKVVYDAAQEYLRQHNMELQKVISVFVQETTEEYKERYRLPGGGRMQRRSGQAQSGAVKPTGSWDVAYPLYDFGSQLAYTDVEFAKMTPNGLQLHLDTIRAQDINTVRFEILYRLFNSAQATFDDPEHGALSIEPLANGDSVLFPPVLGTESEATETHYLESNYAASAIDDTNNPLVTLRNDLEEHFGTPTGFGNTVVFANTANIAKLKALADFVEVVDSNVRAGNDTATPQSLPAAVPGRIVGRCDGTWVVEWRWIPSGWMLAIDLDQPKPLKMRVDEADTGLPRGLALVSTSDTHPMMQSHYRHRYGFGAANRLNGAVIEFNTGGSYTAPSAYA